jgi:hypothetical protein
MIIEEADEVQEYVADVEKKLENKMDEVMDLQMKIDDTNDTWDTAVDQLNMALTVKAQ